MPKHLPISCMLQNLQSVLACRLCCEQSTVQNFLHAAIKEFGQGGLKNQQKSLASGIQGILNLPIFWVTKQGNVW